MRNGVNGGEGIVGAGLGSDAQKINKWEIGVIWGVLEEIDEKF